MKARSPVAPFFELVSFVSLSQYYYYSYYNYSYSSYCSNPLAAFDQTSPSAILSRDTPFPISNTMTRCRVYTASIPLSLLSPSSARYTNLQPAGHAAPWPLPPSSCVDSLGHPTNLEQLWETSIVANRIRGRPLLMYPSIPRSGIWRICEE